MRSRGARYPLASGKGTLANKAGAEDALQPWSADSLREGNSGKKTNDEVGCTEPMAYNGNAKHLCHMDGEFKVCDKRKEEDKLGALYPFTALLPHKGGEQLEHSLTQCRTDCFSKSQLLSR